MIMLTLSNDFQNVADGLVPVTLIRRSNGLETGLTALRRAISEQEVAASNGLYSSTDTHWHLAVEGMEPPHLGDTLREGTTEWTVLRCECHSLGSRHRLTCRNLVVAERLDTLVSIQSVTQTKGIDGALVQLWTDSMTNVRARIQPERFDRVRDAGRDRLQAEYRVFVLPTISVSAKNRIVAGTGEIYRILGIEQFEQLDRCLELIVEEW